MKYGNVNQYASIIYMLLDGINKFLFNCSQWVDILWPRFRQFPLKYLNIISKPVQNSLTDTF